MTPGQSGPTQGRLMVIVPDRLSQLIAKGEVTDRYYNPGELFGEVHIVMTNDDSPDPAALQTMVGSAKLYLHNLQAGKALFVRTLGWRPWLLGPWLKSGVDLARQIEPALVRTHGVFLEGLLASEIKKQLSIPYVTSVHAVWDRLPFFQNPIAERLFVPFRRVLEKRTLRNADVVIAVYDPIARYVNRFGSKNTQIVHNSVSNSIPRKTSYKLSSPIRLLTVNQQIPQKDPENIIRAVADIDCHYMIVGDGICHDRLKAIAREAGCESKVEFVKAIPNDELCRMLPDIDLVVSHCTAWGISKTIIEAGLAGLPIVINRQQPEPVPEYEGGWLDLCDDTPEDYGAAIRRLLDDQGEREALGARAYKHAREQFDPDAMESKVVEIYRGLLDDPAEHSQHHRHAATAR